MRAVYQGRKRKFYDSGQLWNITKLPIIKWKKKITNFCRFLTCHYLLRRLNPQRELIPKQGGLLPWETKRSEIGNTLGFLCMFIQNTAGASWNETCGKVGKRCAHALEPVNLTLLKKWSLLLNWGSICETDHPGSSSWALNPGTSVLEKKHWEKTRWEKRRSPCEDGGREWSYAATSQGILEATCGRGKGFSSRAFRGNMCLPTSWFLVTSRI